MANFLSQLRDSQAPQAGRQFQAMQYVPDDDLPDMGQAPGANASAEVPDDDLPDEYRAAPADPYSGKSLEELKRTYRGSKLVDTGDGTRRKIMDAYVAKQAQEGGFMYALDDVGRQLAKGVPVIGGALDEANAAVASVLPEALGGAPYEESLEYQRARDRFREAQNPESSAAVQLAGGIGGTLAGARALGVPLSGSSAVPLSYRMAGGVAAGLPIGAADGFARGEGGATNRSTNAMFGGLVGGTVGAVAPVVGQTVSSGVQRVRDFLTSDAVLSRLGISREAANVLIRQLGTDDTLSGTGAARIRQGGPDAMVADAGPAAANLLDTALERSGPGSTAARNAIEQRATTANQRLTQTMDQTFGRPVGVETRQAGIRQGTAGARRTAYDDAYDQPIDYASAGGREVEGLLGRVPQEAVNQANRLMRVEGQQSRQIMARVNPDGTVAFERMPDVRQLDYLTRALNEVAAGAEGQGALRGTTAAGRAYGGLATEIRQRLRTLVPEYGQALDIAADPIRRVQATEFGATILNPRVTREQVARQFAGMGGGERRAAISGLRDQIDEIAANVKEMASDPNIDARQLRETFKALSSQAARQKITTAIGQPAARVFYSQVGRSVRALELRASVARNSRTFGRQATDAQVKAQTEPGVIGLALEGEIPRAVKKVIQGLTGMTPERRLAAEDRLYGEIADALTRVRGTQAEQYLNRLRQAVQARSANRNAGRQIGNTAAGVVIGAPATPLDRLTPRGQ